MDKEDKELLIKDICERLSYGVKCYPVTTKGEPNTIGGYCEVSDDFYIREVSGWFHISIIKPYLRPMSSMTRQECTQLNVLLPRYFIVTPECLACLDHINGGIINFEVLDTIIDFYNSHHLDWRGLIPKGLALEAPKDMYKI